MKSNDILKNKTFPIPNEVLKGLKVSLNTFKNSDNKAGLKRAETLLNDKVISFKEMERLKNFFENDNGGDEQEYRLSGGDLMKGFVINGVAKLRKSIDNVKRSKMKGGMDNAYKTTHEKNTDNPTPNVKPDGVGKSADEIANDRVHSESYSKEMDKMRYLIEYMDNNKTIK